MTLQNEGAHVNRIVTTTECKRHHAELGEACWLVTVGATGRRAPAVCGKRIKEAGFNGRINAASLSTKGSSDRKFGKSKR